VLTRQFLFAAVLAACLMVFAGAASAAKGPPGSELNGEVIYKHQVLIPLYDWASGKVIIGSTPENCQYVDTCAPGVSKHIPKAEIQPFYLVVYPLSEKGKIPVGCLHVPADNCPDHGPLIARGAEQLVPSVYGNGVLGHNHISAPVASPEYRVIASPILVLFKTRKAAHELLITKKAIMAAVKRGDAFLYPAPQYMFINYVVPSSQYPLGKAVKPLPTKPGK